MQIADRYKKPEWKDAPEWARYLAQDTSGTWVWYEIEPVYKHGAWEPDIYGRYAVHKQPLPPLNTADTLESRPEPERVEVRDHGVDTILAIPLHKSPLSRRYSELYSRLVVEHIENDLIIKLSSRVSGKYDKHVKIKLV